jgi:hypothetical protein
MKKFLLFLGVVLLLFALSCGGGSSGGGGASNTVNVSGTWKGNYNSSIFGNRTMTLNLQQDNNNSITGSYSSSTGALGTVSGSGSGNTATFTLTVTTFGCKGSFNGTGILSSTATMSFSYSGSSTCGGQESGTGNLTKQ